MGLELYVIMNSLERRHDCILYLVNLKNREGHIFWIRVNIIKKIVWMRYCIIKKKKKKNSLDTIMYDKKKNIMDTIMYHKNILDTIMYHKNILDTIRYLKKK